MNYPSQFSLTLTANKVGVSNQKLRQLKPLCKRSPIHLVYKIIF